MRRHIGILALTLLSFQCKSAGSNAREQAVDGSDLSQLMHAGEKTDFNDKELRDRIERELLGRVRLTLGTDTIGREASTVFLCERTATLQSPCQSVVTGADDTIHVTEFPHVVLNADASLPVGFLNEEGKPATPLDLGFLPAHSHNHRSLRPLSLVDGRVSIESILAKGPVLLVAIFSVDGYVSKHVWVIRKNSK